MSQSRRYVRINGTEFDEFIDDVCPAAERVKMKGVRETVYDLPLPADDLSIRVFSTVQGNEARDRGDDAIRCVVWNHMFDEPIGGRRKTLRITTWRKNLGDKIRDLYVNWRNHDHGTCPRCDSGVLVEREPRGSQSWDAFLACSEWNGGDGCRFTRSL